MPWGVVEHTWVLLQDSIGSLSKPSLQTLSGGGCVLPLFSYNVSEALMSTSVALLTLLDPSVLGLHTVLKSGLHNFLMTSFAMMLVRMIFEGNLFGNSQGPFPYFVLITS